MAVIRVEKTKNYTCMSNIHLRDKNLSLKAKGLLSLILSLPDDWHYTVAGLASIIKEGETVVTNTLSELKKNGYLTVKKLSPAQTDSGRFEYEYTVHEQPVQKQGVEKQGVENNPLETTPLKQPPCNNPLETWVYNNNVNQVQKQNTDINTETKNKAKPPQKSFSEIIEAATENLDLQEALTQFVEFRKSIKKPLTLHALDLLIKKLFELGGTDAERVEILNQSMINGWQGIFAISRRKEYGSKQSGQPYGKNTGRFAGIDKLI